MRARSVLLSCWLMLGCAADLPLVGEGEHVSVRSELPWCEATTDWHDEAIVTIGAWLGLDAEALPHVTYRRTTADEVWAVCGLAYRAATSLPDARAGCAPGHDVWSNYDFDPHEITHALAWRIGYPPAWLVEGLADAIGGERFEYLPVPPDVASLLALESDDAFYDPDREALHYLLAASFVRLLIDVLGREAVLAIYAALPHGASFAQLDSLLEQDHGTSLDVLLAEWERRGVQWWDAIVQPVLGCEGPVIADGPVLLRPAASAFVVHREQLRALRRLPDVGSGWSSIRLSPGDCPGGAWLRVDRCGDHSPPGAEIGVAQGDVGRLIVPRSERTDYVEIGDYPDGGADPLACGTCTPTVELETLDVDACGSVRVRLDASDYVLFAGSARYVTAMREGAGDVHVWAPLDPWGEMSVTQVCVLDGPCGRPQSCFTPSAEVTSVVPSAADGTLHLEIRALDAHPSSLALSP